MTYAMPFLCDGEVLPYVARCVLSLASSGVQSYSNFNSHLTDCGIPFLLQTFRLDAEPKVKKIESDFVTAKVRTSCTMSCTLEHQPKYIPRVYSLNSKATSSYFYISVGRSFRECIYTYQPPVQALLIDVYV